MHSDTLSSTDDSCESGLSKLDLIVTVLRRCHPALLDSTGETCLLTDLCRTLVTLAGYSFCWIGSCKKDNPDPIRPMACFGGYASDTIDESHSWDESGLGTAALLANVLETVTPLCIRHLSAGDAPASCEPWRRTAVSRGYQSVLYLPLFVEKGPPVIGIMALYSADPAGFNDDETALLTLLSRDIAKSLQCLPHENGHTPPDTATDSRHTNHEETAMLQHASLFFDQ